MATLITSSRRALGRLMPWLFLLSGCASPLPPITQYVLRDALPVTVKASTPATTASAAQGGNWQFMLPVRMPEYLDRKDLLLPVGANGIRSAPNQQWAEPLSQSVPRVLTHDLQVLRGTDKIWTSPLPAGLSLRGQVRLEVLAFDVGTNANDVALRARWSVTTLASPNGPATTAAHTIALTLAADNSSVDSLVGAHRLALWQLAEAVSRTLP